MEHPRPIDRRELLRRAGWLLGASLSAPAVLGVLNGCQAAPPSSRWAPRSLNEAQLATVAEVADIMIPATDTPGARDVGVPAFIDSMLAETYPAADRQRYAAGLQAFEDLALRRHGATFVALDGGARRDLVQEVHDAALAGNPARDQRPFILMTKELTLLGYFTSEAGATRVLQYDPLPGAYHGCLPLTGTGNGRTWATDKNLPF